MTVVLDSSVVLAFSFGEPGVADLSFDVTESVLSAVNAVEVLSRLYDRGVAEPQAMLRAQPLTVIPFDAGMALAAAALRPLTRHLGLSLGDRACLALARHLKAPVLTADRAWAGLDVGVDIRVIR